MSVRLPACNNSAPIWRIFVKFDIEYFSKKETSNKIQVLLEKDKDNGHFTWRPNQFHVLFTCKITTATG